MNDCTGAQGPPGQSSLVFVNRVDVIPQMQIQSACTHLTGAEVTVAAPGAGTVVVQVHTGFYIEHTNGVTDLLWLAIGTGATDCADIHTWLRWTSQEPTETFAWSAEVLAYFSLPAAGSYTYYLNGRMQGGASAGDTWEDATPVAVCGTRANTGSAWPSTAQTTAATKDAACGNACSSTSRSTATPWA